MKCNEKNLTKVLSTEKVSSKSEGYIDSWGESGHPDLDWNRDVMTPFADLDLKSDSGSDE